MSGPQKTAPLTPEVAFGELPVRQAVFAQIGPSVVSSLIMLVYSLADTYFVGQLDDPDQLAAITVVYPSVLLMQALAALFGAGGASMVSRCLGRGERGRAENIAAFCTVASLLVGGCFTLVTLLAARPMLRLFGADAAVMPHAVRYARWVMVAGAMPTVYSLAMAPLLRAAGLAKKASFGIAAGGILNMILDPFFCFDFGLGLGVEGAAMATALSNLFTALYFTRLVLRGEGGGLLSFSPTRARAGSEQVRDVLAVGTPSALQTGLTMVAVTAMNLFVAPYGGQAVAALGIVKKIDSLPLQIAIGIAQGVLPLLAFNHGAKRHDRVNAATRLAGTLSCGFALCCVTCYELTAPFLVGLFIDDAQTVAYGAVFLRLMCLAMPLMALGYLMIVRFQAMRRSREATILSILRKGSIDIPLLFLMTRLFGVYGAMMVQPIVDLIAL
ncbi:MAG: MATE family efflux transporter, partial [Clostridia bacterium]|nr:MATE family efflux transporter [Clostridia bacterium]